MGAREDLLERLAQRLVGRADDHPVRVGVDGRVGAGKSTFARDLVDAVRSLGRPGVHLDSDGFHHVRAVRRQVADDEARGYYDHAYDLDAVVDRVLRPLGPGGSFTYATAIHDLESDAVVEGETALAEPDAVVVFDCTFLQRGAVRRWWDEVVWLEVDREVALRRGVARDAAALGGVDEATAAYERRYMAACDLYVREERPRQSATIVVDHDDPSRPRLLPA